MLERPDIFAVRDGSRRLVRELGFMRRTLANTRLHPSAVHALIEIGAHEAMTATELTDVLLLDKSTVSRLVGKLIDEGEIASVAHEEDGRAKSLALTERGQNTLKEIDRFANAQVAAAMAVLPGSTRACVVQGLSVYAEALASGRTGKACPAAAIEIMRGFRPGVIGRAVEMHARYYSRLAGFGHVFESRVAAGMAEFSERLERPCNGLWSAAMGDVIVGTAAIDGEDLGVGLAHLRWFIVDDGLRGNGIGRKLLAEALAFCDARGFRETHLWTFRGLNAARRLYEANGFVLVEERPGRQWGEEVIEQRFARTLRQP